MSDSPPDVERQVSPVGRSRRFLKSNKTRTMLIAVVCLGAFGFIVMGINSVRDDTSTTDKPIDTGATTIAQVTPAPPIPPIVEPKPPEPPPTPKVVYTPPPPQVAAPPPIVAAVVSSVRFPADITGEA